MYLYRNEKTYSLKEFNKYQNKKRKEIKNARTINGDFLDGKKMDFENTLKWLNNCKTKLEDIIWEWQTGNDNFDLIDTRLLL